MFKVNNKDTRTTSMALLPLFYDIVTIIIIIIGVHFQLARNRVESYFTFSDISSITQLQWQILLKLLKKALTNCVLDCNNFFLHPYYLTVIYIFCGGSYYEKLVFCVKLYNFQVTKQLYKTLCRKSSSYLLKECQEHVKSQRLIKRFVKYLRWNVIQK